MNVVCYGDSNTYGFDPRSYLGDRYPADQRWPEILARQTGWTVINEGSNGREIPTAAPKLPANTDLLIVMLGSNDLLQGRTAEQAADRMDRFLSCLSSEAYSVHLIAPPLMEWGAWVDNDTLIRQSERYTESLKELAAQRNIGFSDAGMWQIHLTFDGVHFTEEGHRLFAEGLGSDLKALTLYK